MQANQTCITTNNVPMSPFRHSCVKMVISYWLRVSHRRAAVAIEFVAGRLRAAATCVVAYTSGCSDCDLDAERKDYRLIDFVEGSGRDIKFGPPVDTPARELALC